MTRASATDPHDPGTGVAGERAEHVRGVNGPARVRICDTDVLFGTASWTDKTMTAPGVFYPDNVKSADARLRYYASRFPVVEVDSTYYALPARRMADFLEVVLDGERQVSGWQVETIAGTEQRRIRLRVPARTRVEVTLGSRRAAGRLAVTA